MGLIGLERVPVREHVELHNDAGQKVGEVTSGLLTPTADQPVALAYVQAEYAPAGTRLNAMVRGCLAEGRLGVFTPLAEQCAKSRARWRQAGYEAEVVALSPNAGDAEVRAAAESLRPHSPELLVLDCMSYTRETKRIVRDVLKVPAILAVSSAVRTALELVS